MAAMKSRLVAAALSLAVPVLAGAQSPPLVVLSSNATRAVLQSLQPAIEQATGYRGQYFVLQGRLSPLDGIGPRELGLDVLAARLAEGEVQELIIATNPTV